MRPGCRGTCVAPSGGRTRASAGAQGRALRSQAAGGITRTGLTSWNIGELPREFRDGSVVAYPALADAGATVDVRLFETRDAAHAAMWAGTRRLILLGAPAPVKSIAGGF